MRIGACDTNDRVVVVAEIGNNHEGDFGRARAMIAAAADAGADAVKFQTIVPSRLVAADQAARLAALERFQFSRAQFELLADEAASAGVIFLSTPFDVDVVDWLDALVPAHKVASGDNDFLPLLDRVARTGKPVLVSLGFGGDAQAGRIIRFFQQAWARHGFAETALALLHCVASYPTPDDQADLGAIRRLAGLGVTVGYSDHTLGIKAAELAVAAGARVIEKHFTLGKNQSAFRDHQLSADPQELRALVAAVRHAEQMFAPADTAAAGRDLSARRSIATARSLDAGTVIEIGDLMWLRPGTGLRPGQEAAVVGRRTRRSLPSGQLIRPEDLL